MKRFLLLALLLAMPTAYAADCVSTEIKGEMQDADTNPPECRDVNGNAQGQWEALWADGAVSTGQYVNGKTHGQWEIRFKGGNVATGEYVDNKRHGQWKERMKDGGKTWHSPYKNGKKHGTEIIECPKCSDYLKCQKKPWKDGALVDVNKCY